MADVQLRVGDLDAQGGEALEGRGEGAALRRGADDEVALETDAVEGCAGLLDDLHGFDGAVGFGVVVLEVVVVQVPWEALAIFDLTCGSENDADLQLGIRVSGAGCFEGDGEIISAHSVVEDGAAPFTVIVGGFVDNIPVVATSSVVTDHIGNVRLNDLLKLFIRKAAAGNYISSAPFPTTKVTQKQENSPHPGNWLYQVKVWHLVIWPFASAISGTISPDE